MDKEIEKFLAVYERKSKDELLVELFWLLKDKEVKENDDRRVT
jgi:hypothetical protein